MESNSLPSPVAAKFTSNWRGTLALGLVCIIYLWAYFGPALLRDDVFTNDMAEWTSWAYHFRDSSLLATDPNRAHWVANFPVAYRILLQTAAQMIDPQLFGEILGFAMGAMVALLGYRLGRWLCDGRAVGGWAALLLVMLGQVTTFGGFNLLNREAGGLPRSFALTVVILGVTSAYRRNWPAMGACFLLGALCYPPSCIMLATYSTVVLVSDVTRTRRLPPGFWPFVALAAVSAALLAGISAQAHATTGPLYTLSDMVRMPEFFPGGSSPFFHDRWVDYVLEALMFDGSRLSMLWIVMVVATLTTGVLRSDRRVMNAAFWALPVSAIINYAGAYAVMLRLFEPNRYLLFPYQVLSLCCAVVVADAAVRWLGPKKMGVLVSRPDRRKVIIAISLGVLALAGTSVFIARMRMGLGGMRDTMPSAVYERLRALPAGTVIASLPADGDRIPMRSQRSVLLMNPSFFPYHPNYYGPNVRKLEAVMGALYDPTPSGAVALRDEYRVRYLLVEQTLGSSDPLFKQRPFVESFARWNSRLSGRQAYVLSAPPNSIVFREGSYLLLDLTRIK